MTRFEKIKSGDEKTVANALVQYAAALMNGTAPVGCETCGWNPAEAERRKEIISSECHPSKDKPYRLNLKGEPHEI